LGSPYIKPNAAEQSELNKTCNAAYSHPEGTHDDQLWALALAAYAAVQPTASRPEAKTA
jgi:hypothetical protein